jgi:hypothetical protein
MRIIDLVTNFAGPSCGSNSFFNFPTWYKYLPSVDGSDPSAPQISGIGDVWLIVAAVLDILLRIAAMAAVVFVIWGGVQYITSEGQAEKTAQARKTIANALIGLVLSVGAAAVVTFIAGRFN